MATSITFTNRIQPVANISHTCQLSVFQGKAKNAYSALCRCVFLLLDAQPSPPDGGGETSGAAFYSRIEYPYILGCSLVNVPGQRLQYFNPNIDIMLRSYTQAINLQEKRTGALFREETKANCLSGKGLYNY